MNLIYNTAIRLYSFGANIASLKSPKVKKMIKGQRLALQTLKTAFGDEGCDLWIHAASLGEFEQGRPLIERLKRENPNIKILLSFFSPSGYEVRHNYPMVDCVVYLPFDTPKNAQKFIDAAKPRKVIFVKYEFWGNYLQALNNRNIPTYIISAIFRESQVFFKWYGGTFRRILRTFNHLYIQDVNSRKLLASIGINNTTVAGDTRFDRVTDVMRSTVEMPAMEKFTSGSTFTLIVGSSWEADEARYMQWVNNHPEAKIIIAPHEFNDERLSLLISQISGKAMLYSEYEKNPDNEIRAVIIDSFGKLSSLYRYADVAYIGGGFGVGIHNINEAAVYAMPIVFGPKYSKFKEARDLIKLEGAFTVSNAEECNTVLDNLSENSEYRKKAGHIAGKYIKNNIGATDKIYKDLFTNRTKNQQVAD
jgi:3-deoxy-D-manno-octulosonic-acid transferase